VTTISFLGELFNRLSIQSKAGRNKMLEK